MQLHAFMTAYRDEILSAAHHELPDGEAHDGLALYLAAFFDETLRALRRDSGIAEAQSPLPGSSETAARFGSDRQRAGVSVTQVPIIFAAMSQALGKTGERYGLTIAAEDYKRLNSCLDTGVATSIETYWRRDKARENQVITEQFGFMAHELRNALSNASMAFKLLRTGDLELNMNGRTADVLARNLVRMEQLIAQCIAGVKLEVGAPPELVPVNVASVLRNLEASAILERGISIALELDDELVISADELLLTSAVSNLLHNAVKFSPANAQVQVRALASGNTALIEVEDHGGGLGNENPAALFQPFVKGRDGSQKGTGLGLSIAKRAVEAMHGELRVVDRPGQGCVFTLRFPLLPA